MPGKISPPPINAQLGSGISLNPLWLKWFREVESWCNSIRQEAYNVYTKSTALTIDDLGKVIICNIGTGNANMTLPHVGASDLYSWITLVRIGTGRLLVHANDSDRIERSSPGSSVWCQEEGRVAANITLELVDEDLWAIMSGTGIWKTA
jgi:hypothetical protein